MEHDFFVCDMTFYNTGYRQQLWESLLSVIWGGYD